MSWTESFTEWVVDGKPLQVSLSRYGSGPEMLLLPALSSISTRDELRVLQRRLGGDIIRPFPLTGRAKGVEQQVINPAISQIIEFIKRNLYTFLYIFIYRLGLL